MTVSSQMQEVSKDQSIKLLKNLVWITVLLADIRWPDLNSPDLMHSSDHLLENAYYILTPGGQVRLKSLRNSQN